MNTQEFRGLSGLLALYSTRMLGLFMVLPVLTLYLDQYSGSTTLLMGVALGIYGLTQGLLQIPLGLLSDKIGRKSVIVGGMVVFLVGSLVAATAESIYGLILGRALQGTGAIASTVMALLSDLTTEENRTKAMAAIGGSIGLSFAVAMIAGPIVASAGGLSAIFWVTACLAAGGVLLVLLWIPSPGAVSHLTATEALPAPKLLASTLKNTQLLRLDFGVFVLHMAQMASWIAVPFLLRERYQVELGQHWLIYLGTMGVGFLLMLPLMILGERHQKLKQTFVCGIVILALAETILCVADDSFSLFVFGLLIFFTGFNLLEAILPSLVSKITPSGSRGTAMGIFSSSQFLGAFAGGSLGGYIAGSFGYDAVFLFAAGMAVVWGVVAAFMSQPKHWGTVIVDLVNYPSLSGHNPGIRENCQGVEEITLFPDRQLMYLKVDKKVFSRNRLEDVLVSCSADSSGP